VLCPLRRGSSTRIFLSPGTITCSPDSLCGPVLKTQEHSSTRYRTVSLRWVSAELHTGASHSQNQREPSTDQHWYSGSVLVMHRGETSDRRQDKSEKEMRGCGDINKNNKHNSIHSFTFLWTITHRHAKKLNQIFPSHKSSRLPASIKSQIYSKLMIQRFGTRTLQQSRTNAPKALFAGKTWSHDTCDLNAAWQLTEDTVGLFSLCLFDFLKAQNTPVTKYSTWYKDSDILISNTHKTQNGLYVLAPWQLIYTERETMCSYISSPLWR